MNPELIGYRNIKFTFWLQKGCKISYGMERVCDVFKNFTTYYSVVCVTDECEILCHVTDERWFCFGVNVECVCRTMKIPTRSNF